MWCLFTPMRTVSIPTSRGEDGDVVPLHSDADRVDPDLAGGREGKLGVSTDRIVSHAPPLASPMT